jgi:NAD(P)-dependent dehydrogenase (short-subunit alcohol dehydrogenase family)
MFRFDGKHIVIAGGTSGIGLAVAQRVKQLGATVTVIGRNSLQLDELQSQGFTCLGCDLSDTASFSDVIAKLEAFDGLLFAAGMAESARPFAMLTAQSLQELFTLNTLAPFELIKLSQKKRKINEGGAICYISSVIEKCGTVASGGYGATKSAFSALARSMGMELSKKKIRINTVAYGYVKTKFLDGLSLSHESIKSAPYGLPSAQEAADIAVFLLSDASKFMTRQTIVADSGVTLHQALV